jgi:cardiolipin synthase
MIRFFDGNRVTLLRTGAEYFPALERSIEKAHTEIYLETYIFADDRTGRSIAAALCRASQRGVRVHVLLDGFGAKDMAAPLRQGMLDAGVGRSRYAEDTVWWD